MNDRKFFFELMLVLLTCFVAAVVLGMGAPGSDDGYSEQVKLSRLERQERNGNGDQRSPHLKNQPHSLKDY